MSSLKPALRRELRVACSRHAQPVWFRIVKWVALIAAVARYHDHPAFGRTIAVVTVAALALHLFYRWKTQVWSRAWGGWNDLPAGRD